jgi:hypothetical protein
MSELQTHLSSLFLTNLVVANFSEVLLPPLTAWFKRVISECWDACKAQYTHQPLDHSRAAKFPEAQVYLYVCGFGGGLYHCMNVPTGWVDFF